MKILIAEDDRVSRIVLERYLAKWGYTVYAADNGEVAWSLLQRHNDIYMAVVDWIMPGINGVDLCRRIRESPGFDMLYFVLLTSRSEKQDLAFGLDSGADDYLIKPFDPVELRSRLKVGERLVESKIMLREKNQELSRFANEMESLAKERAKMLIHADRLASLGTLTAGIAHEINNPTTFISGNIQILKRNYEILDQALRCYQKNNPEDNKVKVLQEELHNMLEDMHLGVKRISSIVKGLKSFSRIDRGDFSNCQVNECIKQSLMLCKNSFKHKVKVVEELDLQLPLIYGDAQKLEQVFINLFVNSADAMSNMGSGVLRIRTFSRQDDVIVQVHDTGPGVPPNILDEIWQPFFTTKPTGKGTGLGLSISQGIIHDHHGKITVSNPEEGGALFEIVLPMIRRV